MLNTACFCGRKMDSELRSVPLFAIDVYKAPVAFHYGQRSRQAQTSALAELFSCKKRLKYPIEYPRRDARASVRDFDQDIDTWTGSSVLGDIAFIDPSIFGPNSKCAAVGHRVASVYAQIHQHLMNLCGIAGYRPQVFCQAHIDLD